MNLYKYLYITEEFRWLIVVDCPGVEAVGASRPLNSYRQLIARQPHRHAGAEGVAAPRIDLLPALSDTKTTPGQLA